MSTADRRTPDTRGARIFEAELTFQRIDAASTVKLLAGAPNMEGFVTVESARMIVAKTLQEVAEQSCDIDRMNLLLTAHEIDPEVPDPTVGT